MGTRHYKTPRQHSTGERHVKTTLRRFFTQRFQRGKVSSSSVAEKNGEHFELVLCLHLLRLPQKDGVTGAAG